MPTIIVTSSDFAQHDEKVSMYVSDDHGKDTFCVDAPRLAGTFTGSGDLTAALLLAWLEKCGNDIRLACRKAMAAVSMVLRNTVANHEDGGGGKGNPACPWPELALIESADELLHPDEAHVTVREWKGP